MLSNATFALLMASVTLDGESRDLGKVVPAVYYRGHVFVHYLDRHHRYLDQKQKSYVIFVKALNTVSITTLITTRNGSSNGLDSLFVRGPILVFVPNKFRMGVLREWMNISVYYLSADQLCNAKWIFVQTNGEPFNVPDLMFPGIWSRDTEMPLPADLREEPPTPGEQRLTHTAVAALGERDLLVFDLLVTEPPEDRPPPRPKPPRLVVTQVVPKEMAPAVGSKPKVRLAGEIASSFTEPFQAYVVGEDYYFITKSGRVFRSPPAEEVRPRGMVAVSEPPGHGRLYLISDGGREGVHFLLQQAGADGRWEYNRLGPDSERKPLTEPRRGPDQSELEPAEVVRQLAQQLKHAGEIE